MLQTHRMLSKRIHISLNRYKLKTLLSAIGHFRVCEWKYPTFFEACFQPSRKKEAAAWGSCHALRDICDIM